MSATYLDKKEAEQRAKRIKQLQAEMNQMAGYDWSAEDKGRWQALSAEFEQLSADTENDTKARRKETNEIVEGSWSGYHQAQAKERDQAAASDIDQAISAFCRHSAGMPIAYEQFEACQRVGLDPRAGAFTIALPSSRPRLGSGYSFFAASPQSSQVGTAGGYTIASGFVNRLEVAMKQYASMLGVAEVMVTDNGADLHWPTLDDTSNTGSYIGENTETSVQEVTFGSRIFRSYKFTSGIVKVPHELIEDSALQLADVLGTALGTRLGRILNTEATTGTGAGGKLEGIMVGATVGKTAASQTAVTMDEIIDLQHSIDPAYRAGGDCGFLMHSDVAAVVRKLKDGDGQYLWQDSTQIGMPNRLLGEPVTLNQDMDNAMTTGKKIIAYGRLASFKIRLVGGAATSGGGIRLLHLKERYAELDQEAFIAFLRADSALLKPSSTASLSPVRYLALA